MVCIVTELSIEKAVAAVIFVKKQRSLILADLKDFFINSQNLFNYVFELLPSIAEL